MARKRVALRQFSVYTERDDGGVALVHSYRQCDWSEWVDGMTPGEIARAARTHARVCDGKPQPEPEPPARPPGIGFVPGVWGEEIKAAFARSMCFDGGRPMAALLGT